MAHEQDDFFIFPGSIREAEEYFGMTLSYVRRTGPDKGVFAEQFIRKGESYAGSGLSDLSCHPELEGIVGIVNATMQIEHKPNIRPMTWVRYYGLPVRLAKTPPYR